MGQRRSMVLWSNRCCPSTFIRLTVWGEFLSLSATSRKLTTARLEFPSWVLTALEAKPRAISSNIKISIFFSIIRNPSKTKQRQNPKKKHGTARSSDNNVTHDQPPHPHTQTPTGQRARSPPCRLRPRFPLLLPHIPLFAPNNRQARTRAPPRAPR